MEKELKTILAPLNDYIKKVEEYIDKNFHTGIPIVDQCGLHLFQGGGKRIRASLVILTSGLKGVIPAGIIELAAATEIVHAASLIHDDIIDQSILRRGNVSVPEKWGNKISVLVGDYMYSIALSAAVNDGDPRLFPLMVNGTKDMVMGELYQLQFSNLDNITREHYNNIIELKTGRFMAFSSKLGGVKCGFDDEKCDVLYRFGLLLGYAFQIIDDTLDLVGTDEMIGKDVGNDLRDGKITLPFVFFIEDKGDNGRAILKKYINNPDQGSWEEIKSMLENSGSIERSIAAARDYTNEAKNILSRFPATPSREMLMELAEYFVVRKS